MAKEPSLQTRQLSKNFGAHRAVSNVDLVLRSNEICCLIGPNGAGKTTLLQMLSGCTRPSSGRIEAFGRNVAGQPSFRFARLGILRKYQHPRTIPSLSVRNNVQLGARINRRGRVFGDDEILDLLLLSKVEHLESRELSHGHKQMLELAMVLAAGPSVLLLDEPSSGLADDEKATVIRVLGMLQSRMTILVIDHDMQFISRLDTRTFVMHRGEILVEGSFGQVQRNQTVRDIYLGVV